MANNNKIELFHDKSLELLIEGALNSAKSHIAGMDGETFKQKSDAEILTETMGKFQFQPAHLLGDCLEIWRKEIPINTDSWIRAAYAQSYSGESALLHASYKVTAKRTIPNYQIVHVWQVETAEDQKRIVFQIEYRNAEERDQEVNRIHAAIAIIAARINDQAEIFDNIKPEWERQLRAKIADRRKIQGLL